MASVWDQFPRADAIQAPASGQPQSAAPQTNIWDQFPRAAQQPTQAASAQHAAEGSDSGAPVMNDKTGLYDYGGKSYTPEDLQTQMNAELTAAQRYKDEPRLVNDLRSGVREMTGGWSPAIIGKLKSAFDGSNAATNTAVEKRMSDINAEQRPIEDAASRIAGGVGGVVGGAQLIRAAPGGGAALDAIENTIGRIPATTRYGRQAVAEAQATGAVPPVTLGTGMAASGLTMAPFAASNEMADKGVSFENAATGAAKGLGEGALMGGALHGATEAIAPWATRNAQQLVDQGVPLSFGQTVGGIPQRLENIAATTPLVGAFVRGTVNNATDNLNRQAVNRALEPIQQELPQAIRTGHDAVDHMFNQLGGAYDAILPHINAPVSEFAPNIGGRATPWALDMQDIRQDALRDGLRGEGLNRLNGLIQSVEERANLAGYSPTVGAPPIVQGAALKRIESTLSGEGRALRASNNVDQNQVAPYVERIQASFRDLLARVNPTYAPALQAINQGYGVAAVVRKAAGSAGGNDGIFTASQFDRAVKAKDSSVSKGAYSRGLARLQDLSAPAAATMKTFPDSGTPERGMTMALLGGGAALGTNPGVIAAGAAIPALYNPVTQRLLRNLAAGAPQTRTAVSEAVAADAHRAVPGLLSSLFGG